MEGIDVDIIDSADSHNPVIKVEQNDSKRLAVLQIDKYQAAGLAEELEDKVKELNGEIE